MSQTHPVTMQTFESVIEAHPLVLLDFWAGWCAPCKTLSPLLEELAKHHTDIFIGKVNIEEAKDLAEAFQVRSVPTLMAFKNTELVFEATGLLQPQQFEDLFEKLRTLVVEPRTEEENP